MKLWAISDLHVGNPTNRAALTELADYGDDWLILAGDIGETLEHLKFCFETLSTRFAKLIWVPGNHELWTTPREDPTLRGEAKYRALIDLARAFDVLTPEDDFPVWEGAEGPVLLAPLFLLYDYSFRPSEVARHEVLDWAAETRALSADEFYLRPDPYPSLEAWCQARLAVSQARLEARPHPELPTLLINHFPLRRDLVTLPRVPRLTPWCGTTATEDWHRRYAAQVVVSGHLHLRRTDWRDGTRFEEVSLGQPRQWDQARGIAHYLRPILPAPARSGYEENGLKLTRRHLESLDG
jgi:3',5'-cyclic AMP phosphodiesterase CpdA